MVDLVVVCFFISFYNENIRYGYILSVINIVLDIAILKLFYVCYLFKDLDFKLLKS